MKHPIIGLFVALSVFVLLVVPASAGPRGNAAASAACENGGYLTYTRADGSTFKNEGHCVNYAARGGVLTPAPTATATLGFSFHPIGGCVPYLEVDGYADGNYAVTFTDHEFATPFTLVVTNGSGTVAATDANGVPLVVYPYDYSTVFGPVSAYVDGDVVDTRILAVVDPDQPDACSSTQG